MRSALGKSKIFSNRKLIYKKNHKHVESTPF